MKLSCSLPSGTCFIAGIQSTEKCYMCPHLVVNVGDSVITNKLSTAVKVDDNQSLARRFDSGKLRWRNFPMFLLKPLMEVAQYGEGKYDAYNFLKGGSQNQYLDCIKRHLTSYEDPFEDDNDNESKVNHLAHVAWNALVAIYMLEKHPELDDRFKIIKQDESKHV